MHPAKPETAIIVSIILHDMSVSLIDKLKYSLNNQKPPSFTCEKIILPEPVAKTKRTGFMELVMNIGARIPAVVMAATVAEPNAMRMSAAIPQQRMMGEI